MFGLTTTRRHQRETDALNAQIAGLRAARDQAREERDSFKTVAKAAAQRQLTADESARLIEGGRFDRPLPSSVVLQQSRAQARALELRLAELQAATEKCTCSSNPHTPRICTCGHGHLAHTVSAPHSCTAGDQVCPCSAYRQLPHAAAVEQVERNRKAAAERERRSAEQAK